jgi:hypothetical protein
MKTVIRIEHPYDGNGIWCSMNKDRVRLIELLSNHDEFEERHGRFPVVFVDIDHFIQNIHYCAFKSIEQLQEWVYSNEIKELISLGFKVYMIDLSVYLEGEYQIAFNKADILQSKDITELFI